MKTTQFALSSLYFGFVLSNKYRNDLTVPVCRSIQRDLIPCNWEKCHHF